MKKVCVEITTTYFIVNGKTVRTIAEVDEIIRDTAPQQIEITSVYISDPIYPFCIKILNVADAIKTCKLLYINVYIHYEGQPNQPPWPKFKNIKTLYLGPRSSAVTPAYVENTTIVNMWYSGQLVRDHLTMDRWIADNLWNETTRCSVAEHPYNIVTYKQWRPDMAYQLRRNRAHLDAWNENFPPLFLLLKKRVGPDIARLITRTYLCPWDLGIKITKTSVAAKRRVKEHARMLRLRAQRHQLDADERDLKRQRDELNVKLVSIKRRKKEIIALLK